MRHALKRHPDSPCLAAVDVEVDAVRRRPGELLLHYRLTGIEGLVIPAAAAPTRADELWRHTCFEAFVRSLPGEGYYEFNLAPSTQWAAYRFSGYRNGMSIAAEIVPRMEVACSAGRFELRTCLKLDELPGFPNDATWRVGLAAVIEETSGRKSWWALAHPPGKPDFHHADCFAVELS
jgi:hypothetical protein